MGKRFGWTKLEIDFFPKILPSHKALCSSSKGFSEGEIPWTSHSISDMASKVEDFEPLLEGSEDVDNTQSVSLDVLLPDDLLERILAYLPIPSIFRVGCVCKRWNEVVSSRTFLRICSSNQSQNPWYFMFTSNEAAEGYAYDPIFQKWYGRLELPCVEARNWFVSSSCGLVCFMDSDSRSRLYVCNPITRVSRRLNEPPGGKFADHIALSMTTDSSSQSYTVTVVKTRLVPGLLPQWEVSIHVYDSKTTMWITPVKEVLSEFRVENESVICNGVLYCLIYCYARMRDPEIHHISVVRYDLSAGSPQSSLLNSLVPPPCSLACGRLMNLKERLVMVGGVHDRSGGIMGIGIWELEEQEWREISRMPNGFFQVFSLCDYVFASSGAGDLIYIHRYGAPALIVFDMNHKQWKWSLKRPVAERCSDGIFTGFCFEPSLEASP